MTYLMLKVFSLGLSFLWFLVIIAFLTPSANGKQTVVLGGREDIAHVGTNKEIQELGRFCAEKIIVEEHKKDPDWPPKWQFWSVVSAQKQVVAAGTKYYLGIELQNLEHGPNKLFDAVLVVQPSLHSKKMLSFKPAFDN